MSAILEKLTGGDRRSIGRSAEVVAEVLAQPGLFPDLFEGLLHPDPLVRMRAADAVEKVTLAHPEWLQPFKDRLIEEVSCLKQQEARWHFAQLITRVTLEPAERLTVFGILVDFLRDESRIVKTFTMQALAELALQDASFKSRVKAILESVTETGSPAMKARGKRLLKRLGQSSESGEGLTSRRKIRCQGAIIQDDHVLLIQHREHDGGRSYWLFPGGGQEAGESEEECVRREMLEETGLTVRVERLLVDMREPAGSAYQCHHTYLCVPLSGQAQPGYEPEVEASRQYGIVAVRWVDLRAETGWAEELFQDRITYPELKAVQNKLGYI
jgi:8-oxo-dGTP pyrophosphatase MutT (NUDIX family)